MNAKPLALIIEDNEDQNLVFTNALMQAGYETELIQDGATAMKRLSEVIPDIVILDLHIPGINGGLILREISQGSARPTCPRDHRLSGCGVRGQSTSTGGHRFVEAC